MLSIALSLLLVTWAVSAARYSLFLRRTDGGYALQPVHERSVERLAA